MQEINEPYYQLYLNSDNFIDMTDNLTCVIRNGATILGEHRCGKSTFLSMVRCFLDEKLSFTDMFGEEAAEKVRKEIYEELNTFHVINIDFTDFAAETYDDAITYLKRKMSDLYFSFKDYVMAPENACANTRDSCLSIMDMTAEEDNLKYSLRRIISILNRSKRHSSFKNDAVLIMDESNRMSIAAHHFGYGEEMDAFIKDFLRIDPYDDLFSIIETGYEPFDMSIYNTHHCCHRYVVSRIDCLRKVCELNGIPVFDLNKDDEYNSCFGRHSHICSVERAYSLMPPAKTEQLPQQWDESRTQYMKDMRCKIDDELEQDRLRKIEREKAERERYKMGLPDGVHIPSRNVGIRDYLIDTDTPAYQKLEQLVRDLFVKFGSTATHTDLFQEMHCVDDNVRSDWNEKYYNQLKQELDKYADRWKHLNIEKHNNHWCFVNGTPKNEDDEITCLMYIKMYISVPDDIHISTLFMDAVRVLADKGINSFTAKVSKYKRHDAICIWVSRHDFFLMEQFFKSREDEICRKLPFIVYRGNIGIGREMASWDSQSGIQCRLFATYFSMKERPEDISLSEMYSLFVQGWNGDLPDDHPMTKEFKSENAQIMLVLLDSLDVNLGITELNDQHIFLQDDKRTWNPLCDENCWADVGEEYLRETD